MYLLKIFAILSLCYGSLENCDFASNRLLNKGSKTTPTSTIETDSHGDLVNTMIKNVDSIFRGWDYTEKTIRNIIQYDTIKDGELDFRNLEDTHILQKQIEDASPIPLKDVDVSGFAATPHRDAAKTVTPTTKQEIPFSPKPLFPMTGPLSTLILHHARQPHQSLTADSLNISRITPTKYRSCILCDNLENVDCNDPGNGRVATVIDCEDEDDVCYSQHTPFGVVKRGCYSARNNLTTYVCACNLCNHISITDMPYMFTSKKYWVKNVIELSRLRHLTKSVFKDMRCIRCEVNGTSANFFSDRDMMEEVDCLTPSNLESMKTEKCPNDYICGVQTKPNEHFVWRGCVQAPLYNYWLQTCTRDLCNHDPIVSVYT